MYLLIAIIFIVIFIMFTMMVRSIVDCKVKGIVTNKYHIPAHTKKTMISCLAVPIFADVPIPDTWIVQVQDKHGHLHNMPTKKEQFDAICIGQEIKL